jgi:hypothetical protein
MTFVGFCGGFDQRLMIGGMDLSNFVQTPPEQPICDRDEFGQRGNCCQNIRDEFGQRGSCCQNIRDEIERSWSEW